MRIELDRDGTPEVLVELLSALERDPGVGSIVVFACAANGLEPDRVNDAFRSLRKPVFGGVFPRIVHGGELLERGVMVVGLPCVARVHEIESLPASPRELEGALLDAFPESTIEAGRTMFVFVDGLARGIGALIDALFNSFGLDLDYVGGGAGSLSLVSEPCIFGPSGLRRDAAVVALVELSCGVGVAHGWRPISEGFKVTSSEGNVIRSLDWRPAFEVYREVVEGHAGRPLLRDAFFDLAKAYPFGITKLANETVVRDPLKLEGDALVCVGEVPEGAFVRILHGEPTSLIDAARRARELAGEAMGARSATAQVFIDCVSRVLFLEGAFERELAAVSGGAPPTFGALTLGEIANNGRQYLEFYNKTAVVGLLGP
jgi:hypothetical protein